MFDGIPITALGDIGASTLLVLAVLLLFMGGLIPRWMHKERIADKDARINYLQTALDKRDEQVTTLINGHEMIIQLLQSIKDEAERHHA